jgi:hypothetical protein
VGVRSERQRRIAIDAQSEWTDEQLRALEIAEKVAKRNAELIARLDRGEE